MSLSSFLWSVADLLRGKFKPHEYGKVILPFTVLRRMDCVLEPTKPAVLAELNKHHGSGVNSEHFLRRASKASFYNTSPMDLKAIAGDPSNVAGNLLSYIHAFSKDVADIFERFELPAQIDRLQKADLLYLITEKFASIDSPRWQIAWCDVSKRPVSVGRIFDYGNTALEKRSIFYKRLIPLLEFEREREGIDLSLVVLTHHNLRNTGKRNLKLGGDESPTLKPMTDSGSGSVQEKEKALLEEIIAKVNDLFGADTTDGDQLVYVNNVLKGKLLESDVLIQQANSNTKEQFAKSPDLDEAIVNAIMDAFAAHSSLSKQALDSERVRTGLKSVLLGPAQLYETLRARSDGGELASV